MASPAKPSTSIDWAGRIQEQDEGVPKVSVCVTSRDSGEGKSESAYSFPDPFVLLFDGNDGLVKSKNIPYMNLGSTDGFRQFITEILPALFHRDPYFTKYQTIIPDSFSHMQPFLLGSVEMPSTNRGEDDTQRWYGNSKTRGLDVLRQLTQICQPYPPDPSAHRWNVVVPCHLQEVYKKVKQDRDTVPVIEKYAPMIEGAVRNLFHGYFNTVLVLQKSRVVINGQMVTKYKAHSESPEGNLYTTKDTIGGWGKRWQALPAEMDITNRSLYDVLASAWGFPQVEK